MNRLFFLCLFINCYQLCADVISLSGEILFDVESDGQSEMILNQNGLGISTLNPSQSLDVQGNAIIGGLTIGSSSSGSSNLHLNGTYGFSLQSISSNATLGEHSIIHVDSSSDNVTVTLPYAGNVIGRQYIIKKTSSSNEVIVVPGPGDVLDQSFYNVLVSGAKGSIEVMSTATAQWYILSSTSSNLMWSPAYLDTTLWFDASDISTVQYGNSSNVYQWNDKSGNDHHATLGDEGGHPIYQTSGFGTRNTLVFTATNNTGLKITDTVTLNNTDQSTLFAVFQSTSSSETYCFVFRGSNSGSIGVGFQGITTRRFMFGDQNNLDAGYDYSQVIWAARLENGQDLDLWENGVNEFTSTGTMQTIPSTITNATIGYQPPSYSLDGKISEIILFNTALTTADRQKVEGYLAWKWGLVSKLDVSHPYYDNPPY